MREMKVSKPLRPDQRADLEDVKRRIDRILPMVASKGPLCWHIDYFDGVLAGLLKQASERIGDIIKLDDAAEKLRAQ
jgi:hypothetical protein